MTTGTEDTQVPGTAAPASPPATTTQSAAPEGYVEIARLNGALAKIQELTLANRALTDQLAAANQKIGQMESDFSQKSANWQATQSEFDTKLRSAETEKGTLASKLSAYEAKDLKLKVIGELQRPELYALIDIIPDMADEAALKTKIQGLANFATQLTQKREQELVAGIIPTENIDKGGQKLPSSSEGWQSYINTLPLGSPERKTAFDQWHTWLSTQQSS